MAKIEKSIFINAPVEKVFAFMVEPTNMPEIWPSMIEIKNMQPLPNGLNCYDWVYKMAGMRFEGHSESIEIVPNQRVVTRGEGGIPNTFIWTYQPEETGTRITVNADYNLPGALLGKLAEPIIHKMNEHEGETILANLKALMEG